ncbi:uncharacterized protein LOC127739389 [Mytilus californianus]|uniref:uncharacterized protein LOC127739389 n=1 Tax=Mytilus californianus TaxID=6549 RepID=UPI0022458708|nr:uncharacterized protein LOC127739389 [Mytilus californianus]
MVRLRRNIYNIYDIISNKGLSSFQICSGSAVEGLDMIGSDVDIMYLFNDIVVCTSERDAENVAKITHVTTLIMDTDNTNPCYALLRVPKNVPFPGNMQWFLVHEGQDDFFSSQLLKLECLNRISRPGYLFKIHGPCLTTEDDSLDLACCLRCKCWPSQARSWMLRSRNNWPSQKLISKVVNFGVLFVPIGCKGSIYEHIEWRMSFSVAEKLLIYSFSHTQMLCYGLMKLLLKDVIDKRESLKGLLCSYFLKTLLFWLYEESGKDIWIPENMLSCFRACICRLLYCTQYSILVHYFIPQNNFFEDRYKDDDRIQMIGLLQEAYKLGLQCFCVSGTFTGDFHIIYNPTHDSMTIHRMLRPLIYYLATHFEKNENCFVMLNKINRFDGIKLASKLIMFLLAKSNNLKVQQNTTPHYYNNKLRYHQFKQQQGRLLISSHSGFSEVGWLFLASFFYRHKRYDIVLKLISHILSRALKADASFAYITRIPADMDQTQLKYKYDVLPAMCILRLLVDTIMVFEGDSSLIPEELDIEVTNNVPFQVDIIILTHFLRFLSNYHLGEFMSCMGSLGSLEANAQTWYRHNIVGKRQITTSFLCLGVAHEMMGHLDKAHECFSTCVSQGIWNLTKAELRLSKL